MKQVINKTKSWDPIQLRTLKKSGQETILSQLNYNINQVFLSNVQSNHVEVLPESQTLHCSCLVWPTFVSWSVHLKKRRQRHIIRHRQKQRQRHIRLSLYLSFWFRRGDSSRIRRGKRERETRRDHRRFRRGGVEEIDRDQERSSSRSRRGGVEETERHEHD